MVDLLPLDGVVVVVVDVVGVADVVPSVAVEAPPPPPLPDPPPPPPRRPPPPPSIIMPNSSL
jgi:hypothetical protein